MELVEKLSEALMTADSVEIGPAQLQVEDLPEHLDRNDTFSPFILVKDADNDGDVVETVYVGKGDLYKATAVAQKTFRQTIDTSPVSKQMLHISNVLLLGAYEHHSATNVRHKLVEQGILSPEAELRFLGLLLTSKKLPKQTKSPTLWHYRRSLVKSVSRDVFTPSPLFRAPGLLQLDEINRGLETPYYDFSGLGPFLEHEFEVILRSAAAHKHNYYAWGYARWLTEHEIKGDKAELRKLLSMTLWWICMSPPDTSSWSFFTYLALKLDDEDRKTILESLKVAQDRFRGRESFYVCLRTLLTSVSEQVAQDWLDSLNESHYDLDEKMGPAAPGTFLELMHTKEKTDVALQKQALNFYYRKEPVVGS
ncbi:hypothetical protein CJU90_3499 [Yarrowia sp. C11]|nr:hypothetical protein CJU90_3499 [Yarrowia sp. C11]